jgi:hypothetical protein
VSLSSTLRNTSSSSSRLSHHRRPSGAATGPLPPPGSRETGEPPPAPCPACHRGGKPQLLCATAVDGGKSNQGESNRGSRGGAVIQSSPAPRETPPSRADGRGSHSYSSASTRARGRDGRRKGRTTVIARPSRASTTPQPWPVLHRCGPHAHGLAPVRGHNLGSSMDKEGVHNVSPWSFARTATPAPLTRLIPHAAINFS